MNNNIIMLSVSHQPTSHHRVMPTGYKWQVDASNPSHTLFPSPPLRTPPPSKMTRSQPLAMPGHELVQGDYVQTPSPMRSPVSAGWHKVPRWESFEAEVRQFFESLSDLETYESVGSSYNTGGEELTQELDVFCHPTSEDSIKDPLQRLYCHPHNATIRSRLLGVARHSMISVWAASRHSFIGQPDFVF
jgi:hypothetical protein